MKKLRVAIIGCGAVAENYYVPALKKLSEQGLVLVVALYDPSESRAEKLQKLCPGSRIVGELSELSSEGIDLAIVSSPVGFHAEQSIEALQLGCAVLCEKPMAKTVFQCKTMVEAAEARGSLLAIGHFRRQFPAVMAIKEILDGALLGAVKSFAFNEGSPFQWPAASPALFNRAEAGGGVLMDLGVHLLDLALWFFGDVEEVHYEDDAMGGVEANCQLGLQFKNGISGQARLSRDWWLDNTYAIECENGTINWKITQATEISVSCAGGERKAVDEVIASRCIAVDGHDHLQAFFNQLSAVVNVVGGSGNGQGLVTGIEAMRSLQLVEACYANGKLISMPWLSETELARAHALRQEASRG